jgi:hypothetical protein
VSERAGILQRIDDGFNPIVVKELRQAVQGKFVAAVLIVLLIIQLTAVGLIIINSRDISTAFDAGRDAFMILQSIMLGICLLFVPAYTAFRLGSERSDSNVDLLFITTIRPRAIIGGKIFASLAITVLIFSACMPFMVFTYWLRGIDLPSIFVMLAFSFLIVVGAVHLATFIASIPANRVFKILLGVAGLCILPQMFVVSLTLSFSLLQSGVGSRLNSWEFWGPASAVILIVLTMIGLLFFMSVALITPISANRALPVRSYVMIVWLIGGIVGGIISYVDREDTAIIVWSIVSAAILFAGFFVSVSERDRLGSRVLRKIPRSGLRRLAAFLLFSGAASGVVWCLLMCALTLGVLLIWPNVSRTPGNLGWSLYVSTPVNSRLSDAIPWIVGLGLYGFCYSMSAVLLRTTLLARWLSPKFTWLIGLVLLAFGSIVPFLIGYLISFDSAPSNERIALTLLGNPFALDYHTPSRSTFLIFASCWAAIVALLNIPWFQNQIGQFRPPEAKEEVRAVSEVR